MAEVVVRGMRFNVVRMGHGAPTIVLVHGLVMDSHASYYLSIAPALARVASVVLYDLRGHGRSEQPPSGYTMTDMVGDLLGILDGIGLRDERVVLVGNSYGGQLVMRVAAAEPHRVRALALLDAQTGIPDFTSQLREVLAADPEGRDRKAYELFGRWLAEHAVKHAGDAAVPTQDFVAQRSETIDGVLQHRKQRRSPGVRTAVGLARDTTLIADLAREVPIPDETIARIVCPALAIYGAQSELREDARRLARLMPQLELAYVPDTGHTVLLEAPTQLRELMLAWLARLPP